MGSLDEDQSRYGHSMKQYFLFDPKWTNLNHGSFGTYPLPVRNARHGYQKLAEYAPDKFMRYQSNDLLKNSRTAVARLLNAEPDDCVFVSNATVGINIVLKNLKYEPNDVIIYFDTIYGAVEKLLSSLMETTPNVQVRKVGYGQDYAYSLPCTHPEILNAFSQTISRLIYDGLKPRVAIFDTIVSIPGVRFPFERLTRMCKEYGILSVVDGAHGVGQIPLNLTSLDADFFVSNCHKWLYTPRGCAVLHIPSRNQPLIRTAIPTSHGFVPDPNHPSTIEHFSTIRNVLAATNAATTPFQSLFQFVGTLDNSPYYCVPAAIKFRNDILGGEEEIYRYIRDVAQRGANLLAMILGTEVMDDMDPGEGLRAMGSVEGQAGGRESRWVGGLRDCAMANVLLPLTIVDGNGKDSSPQGRGSLRSGPGGGGSAGGLSPFGLPLRRSPSPSRSPSGASGALTPTSSTFSFNNPSAQARSPSLTLPPGGGHSYSKSSSAALPPFSPSRSPSMPLPMLQKNPSNSAYYTTDPLKPPPSIAPQYSNGINRTTSNTSSFPLSSSPSHSFTYPKPSQNTLRNISPNSPFAPYRRPSASPLRATILQSDLGTHIAWIERILVEEYNTFVPVFEYKGRIYTRVSGQVYLEVRDFEWLGNVLRGVCERVGEGESLGRVPVQDSEINGGDLHDPIPTPSQERGRPLSGQHSYSYTAGVTKGFAPLESVTTNASTTSLYTSGSLSTSTSINSMSEMTAAQQSEVDRLRGRLGALDTNVSYGGGGAAGRNVSAGTTPTPTTAGGSSVRRFDVRVGRWVDG